MRTGSPPVNPNWRDGRVVEGARLESVFRGNSNVGSNPTLSANGQLSRQLRYVVARHWVSGLVRARDPFTDQ